MAASTVRSRPMPLVDQPAGNYRFLPGIAPYSLRVLAHRRAAEPLRLLLRRHAPERAAPLLVREDGQLGLRAGGPRGAGLRRAVPVGQARGAGRPAARRLAWMPTEGKPANK